MSGGFADAGIAPVFAVDRDPDSVAGYRSNCPGTTVAERDIRELAVADVAAALRRSGDAIRLFAGCAPCQPFAGRQRKSTERDGGRTLLLEFLRFARAFNPELVFVENVAGMGRYEGALREFVKEMSETHHVSYGTVLSADYGAPQMRRCLVLIASRLGVIDLPPPTHGPTGQAPHTTVRKWIHGLPPIGAGEEHPEFDAHKAYRLSDLDLKRIRSTPEGGDGRDWPEHLWPDCHTGDLDGHTDVYGRLWWDKPAPALTTRCISYGNGRYGHPSQDRASGAREPARLQTFPNPFRFAGSLTSQAKQIGNAVRVVLAERFGHHLIEHVRGAD